MICRCGGNVHGVVDGGQHLHHELRVQQHAVAGFPPELLLLPGETAHAQPGGGTQTPVSHECEVTSSGETKTHIETHVLPIKLHHEGAKKKRNQVRRLIINGGEAKLNQQV